MVPDQTRMAADSSRGQTTFANSPRTVKRLNTASSRLQQYAAHKQNPTESQQAWAGEKTNTANKAPDSREGTITKSKNIDNGRVRTRPPNSCLMPPVISNLRRSSLTGSLPDLQNADEDDIQCDLLLLSPASIKRPPLPQGSEQFKQVLEEHKEALEGNENGTDVPKLSLRDLHREANSGELTIRQKFRSKTAEALYFTKFGQCFPKYWSSIKNKQLQEKMGGSHDCLHLPDPDKTNPKHVSWGEVSILVPGRHLHKSTPNSPLSARQAEVKRLTVQLSPSSSSQEGSPSSNGSATPERYQTGSLNRSQTRSLRASLDRLPNARTQSPMASPRLLRRRQTPHVSLHRTVSHD